MSTHNLLYLWFRSDNSTAKDGFELTWDSIDPGMTVKLLHFFCCAAGCGKTLISLIPHSQFVAVK